MKKVLLIAYYFPPAAGVGTFRVTKFVKFLRNFGWEPFVLTVEDELYGPKDTSILEDARVATKIFKTKINSLPVNDVGLKWAWNLYINAKHIIKKEKIDAVYYTGGPFFQWIIAPTVKRKTGVPYVIDYRDPWGMNPYERGTGGIKKKLGDVMTNFFEPRVIKHADGVIFATQDMEREYVKIFPEESRKFSVIENGYDPDDYDNVKPQKFDKFTIAYTGKFSHYRNPDNLFKAVGQFSKEHDCQFVHVGSKEPSVVNSAGKYLSGQSSFVGPKRYKEAISYAKGADVLVLISGGSNIEFTHKVFDYALCDKPILAIVDKRSYLGKFLSNFDNAYILENEPEQIREALSDIFLNKKLSLGAGDSDFLNQYNRRVLTKSLATELDKIFGE